MYYTETKATLRRELKARLASVAPELLAAWSLRAQANALGWRGFAQARTVALYAPLRGEVDTAALVEAALAAGKRVVLPRVTPGTRALAFHAVNAASPLVAGRYGLREPSSSSAPVPPGDVDVFVVPGLGFDRAGGRLGRGAGHYDATLALAPRALRLGLAFELQVVTSLPLEPHDVALHALATEAGLSEPQRVI